MKKIQLSIPQPCHENWEEMTQAEKGRFCTSCQKTVMDFTNMSDRQLAEFFKKSPPSVCGRFYQDQLERDIEIQKKRIPWAKYFFQFTLPAFLISMKGNAQKGKVMVRDTSYCTTTTGLVARAPIIKNISESKKISGEIINASRVGVAFATIMVKGTTYGVQTDGKGQFEIQASPGSILVASAIGYMSKEIKVNDTSSRITIIFASSDEALSGEIVVVGFIRKKAKPIPPLRKIIDTAFKRFFVYPSPAPGSSVIKINLKKSEPGQYTVSIINLSGEIVQTEEVFIENKKQVVDFRLKDIAAGTYFVHLFNRNTAASYSEKIIVQ